MLYHQAAFWRVFVWKGIDGVTGGTCAKLPSTGPGKRGNEIVQLTRTEVGS
jgi:hypothetical protein